MSDERADTRRHVRAAREWLGRAENSLEREDNIRGGLNLMLAEAELQRAKETGEAPGWRRWLFRVLPAVAAAGIAAAFLWTTSLTREQPPSRPSLPATAGAPAAVPAVDTLATDAVPDVRIPLPQEPAVPVTALPMEVVETEPSEPAVLAEEPLNEVPAEPMPASVEPEIVQPGPSIPSEDMQKLMSSAGQTLRAK